MESIKWRKIEQKEEGIIIFEVSLMKTLNALSPVICRNKAATITFMVQTRYLILTMASIFFSLNCDVKDQM